MALFGKLAAVLIILGLLAVTGWILWVAIAAIVWFIIRLIKVTFEWGREDKGWW